MLHVLYRGSLESCNYGCAYCPFAKKVDSRAELARDRSALERFVGWVAGRGTATSVLFTPWGEGLIRRAYQDALVTLTHVPHVARAAIQTNLSAPIGWAARANVDKLALWATFHPEWAARDAFVDKVRALHALGVRVSVGVVGFVRFLDEIEALRRELPPKVYLWVNAARREETYTEAVVKRIEATDPLFALNLRPHASLGRSCRAGASAVSVDADGDVRRCHFIRDVIGNLYDGSFDRALRERPCTNPTCGCHIGYVHLDRLGLYDVFEGGVLERIPHGYPEIRPPQVSEPAGPAIARGPRRLAIVDA